MTQCIGRISKVQGILHFAKGRHRFYLEYRCPNNVITNTNNCARCTGRTTDKIQSSGKYDHGNVNEPIPEHSQMYGGKWYTNACSLWGAPSNEDKETAERHQELARAEFTVMDVPIVVNPEFTVISPIPTKRTKKRIIYPDDPAPAPAPPAPAPAPPAPAPSLQPRKRIIKSKPKNEIIIPIESKSIIATHIETKIEELCIDDYEVEYVKLTLFEHNDITYFREPTKNKLFEKKNKAIGVYIGRYDSYTDTIRTDIPDSDNDD